jgi:hypothetical protein
MERPSALFLTTRFQPEVSALIFEYAGLSGLPRPSVLLGPRGHVRILSEAITAALQVRWKFQGLVECRDGWQERHLHRPGRGMPLVHLDILEYATTLAEELGAYLICPEVEHMCLGFDWFAVRAATSTWEPTAFDAAAPGRTLPAFEFCSAEGVVPRPVRWTTWRERHPLPMRQVAQLLRHSLLPALSRRLICDHPQVARPRVLLVGRRLLADLVVMAGSVLGQLDEHLILCLGEADVSLRGFQAALTPCMPFLTTCKQGFQPVLELFHEAVTGRLSKRASYGNYMHLWAVIRMLTVVAQPIGTTLHSVLAGSQTEVIRRLGDRVAQLTAYLLGHQWAPGDGVTMGAIECFSRQELRAVLQADDVQHGGLGVDHEGLLADETLARLRAWGGSLPAAPRVSGTLLHPALVADRVLAQHLLLCASDAMSYRRQVARISRMALQLRNVLEREGAVTACRHVLGVTIPSFTRYRLGPSPGPAGHRAGELMHWCLSTWERQVFGAMAEAAQLGMAFPGRRAAGDPAEEPLAETASLAGQALANLTTYTFRALGRFAL